MMILWEGLLQGLKGVWTIARVVVPLMIILEIAQANGLLQKLNRILARPFKLIGLGEEGAFPIVVAMAFGLTFGSGVILNHVQEGKVNPTEIKIMGTFIALAHALIEDTIIFMTLGAPFAFLVLPRVLVAYFMAYLVHKFNQKRPLTKGDNVQGIN